MSLPCTTSNDIIIISRQGDLNTIKKICKALPDIVEVNNSFDSVDLLSKIMSAKMVICACGVWTYFCNLHQIPVFSWGDSEISMYKPAGLYHFRNYRSHIVYHSGDGVDKLLSGIEYTLGLI